MREEQREEYLGIPLLRVSFAFFVPSRLVWLRLGRARAPPNRGKLASLMKRRLFTMLSALSLVLCIAAAGLWIRSYYVHDLRILAKDQNGLERVRVSADGRFGMAISTTVPSIGRLYLYERNGEYVYAELAQAFAILPFLWLLDWAVRREVARHNPHACPVCGYDLRASPERCPECGTARDTHH